MTTVRRKDFFAAVYARGFDNLSQERDVAQGITTDTYWGANGEKLGVVQYQTRPAPPGEKRSPTYTLIEKKWGRR